MCPDGQVFLTVPIKAYFFANGGQKVSLRWLALFPDFERARHQLRASVLGLLLLLFGHSQLRDFAPASGALEALQGYFPSLFSCTS